MLESLDRQLGFYDRARSALRTGRLLSKRDYRRAFGDDASLQQVLFWEMFAPPALSGDVRAIDGEVERLRELRREVDASPRSKLGLLVGLVRTIDAPMLIFSGHAATAAAIFEALRGMRRCGLATARDGRDAIGAFIRGSHDVLVSTDLAAEGLNLQRAGAVIHYDLPWNPVKLDQRNGRIHRIGQLRESVHAVYFVPEVERTRASEIVETKNRTRTSVLRPGPVEHHSSVEALPQHIPRDVPQAALLRALDRQRLGAPLQLLRRHRSGAERLIAEAAREILDSSRLDYLVALLAREVEIGHL